MPDAPTIDTALIPGIRTVFELNGGIAASSTSRFATPIIPARSVLRSVYFAADAALSQAIDLRLRIAFGNTLSPAASDFIGTGLILPDTGPAEAAFDYTADPGNSAVPQEYNFQLPDRAARLLIEIQNVNTTQIFSKLRLIIDGLGRLGTNHGSGHIPNSK